MITGTSIAIAVFISAVLLFVVNSVQVYNAKPGEVTNRCPSCDHAFEELAAEDSSDAFASASDAQWYDALTGWNYDRFCGHDDMRVILGELRRRDEHNNKKVTLVIGGGGFGNQLDTILASMVGALITNRTIQVNHLFPVLHLLMPTSSFSAWNHISSEDYTRIRYSNQSSMTTKRVKFNDFIEGVDSEYDELILTDIPNGYTSSYTKINVALRKYLQRGKFDYSSSKVMQCLSREFIRPAPAVTQKLREVVNSFGSRVSVGIHLRKSDNSMAAYMNVTKASKKGLDLRGSETKRHGCTHDFTFRGCLLKYHDNLSKTIFPKKIVYFVAADALESYEVVKKLMIQRNATVIRSEGAPTHTGREWGESPDKVDADRLNGEVKALVDFFTLIHTDHYLANCRIGGNTFSWNIFNSRLGAPSSLGENELCKLCQE